MPLALEIKLHSIYLKLTKCDLFKKCTRTRFVQVYTLLVCLFSLFLEGKDNHVQPFQLSVALTSIAFEKSPLA